MLEIGQGSGFVLEMLTPADIYRRPKYFMLNVPE